MKHTTKWFAVVAVASLSAAVARADADALSKIVRDREAVLAEILSTREARLRTGGGSPEAVFAARVSLLKFRRDTATSWPERLKQQELITDAYRTRLAEFDARAKAGILDVEERLVAKEQLLEAMQTLEGLRSDTPNGSVRP